MHMITYLNIEMNDECNLTAMHPECPRNGERFRGCPQPRPITINDAVGFYRWCVENYNFRGCLCPQFYSEPLMTPNLIMDLMRRIPDAPICLRTNGVLLDDSPDNDWIIRHCVEVWVTVYAQTNIEALNRLCSCYKQVHIVKEPFDNRMAENFEPVYNPKKTYCIRPRYELDVDYYGNGRICCGDWRGELEFGNVIIDGYEPFLQKWLVLREKMWELLNPITPESWIVLPRICKLCLNRTPVMGGSLCE